MILQVLISRKVFLPPLPPLPPLLPLPIKAFNINLVPFIYTLLLPLEPNETSEEDDYESLTLTMSLFLDTLMKEAIEYPSSLILYTEEMSKEISELLSDVTL